MQSNGIDFTVQMDKDVQVFEESGQTVVMVGVDGMWCVCVCVCMCVCVCVCVCVRNCRGW